MRGLRGECKERLSLMRGLRRSECKGSWSLMRGLRRSEWKEGGL